MPNSRVLLLAGTAVIVAAIVAAIAYGVAGAGNGDGPGDSGGPVSGPQQLAISYLPEAGAKPTTVVVDCTPGQASPVCDDLTDEVLAPTPAGRACTMIYGGPQQLTIKGQRAGRTVDSSFRRDNGCEIARWSAVAEVLAPLNIPGLSG